RNPSPPERKRRSRGMAPPPAAGAPSTRPRRDDAERAIRRGGVMQASTTVRSLRARSGPGRGWRLGPVLVAGLTLALVAAACGVCPGVGPGGPSRILALRMKATER